MTVEDLIYYYPHDVTAIRKYYVGKGQTFGRRFPIHWLKGVYELKRKGKLSKNTGIYVELEQDDWEVIE